MQAAAEFHAKQTGAPCELDEPGADLGRAGAENEPPWEEKPPLDPELMEAREFMAAGALRPIPAELRWKAAEK